MSEPKVRLYVRSDKTISGTVETEWEVFGRDPFSHPDRVKVEGSAAEGTFRVRYFTSETEPKYDFVLPEDQQAVVEMVKKVASKRAVKVEVIDVTREDVIHRVFQREIERIRAFPTLTVSSGEKIEGKITEKEVESILSHNDSFSYSYTR